MTTLRLAPSPWRTDTFRRLGEPAGEHRRREDRQAVRAVADLTVGDLMRHLPRRYFSGTELSDLSALREGEEVAVMAEVVEARSSTYLTDPNYRLANKSRLEATITDHGGRLTCTFFGSPD